MKRNFVRSADHLSPKKATNPRKFGTNSKPVAKKSVAQPTTKNTTQMSGGLVTASHPNLCKIGMPVLTPSTRVRKPTFPKLNFVEKCHLWLSQRFFYLKLWAEIHEHSHMPMKVWDYNRKEAEYMMYKQSLQIRKIEKKMWKNQPVCNSVQPSKNLSNPSI